MNKISETAINECVAELRAACRRPIDQDAIDTLVEWLRPNFERILDRLDGGKRWTDFGQRVRNNSRHLGALADFFGSHADVTAVGIDELTQAFTMVRADCTVRAERTPLALELCPDAPVDVSVAEEFLRAIAPVPELATRVG